MRELGSLSISSLSGIGEGSFWEQWFRCVHRALCMDQVCSHKKKNTFGQESQVFLARGLQAEVRTDDTGWNTKNVCSFLDLDLNGIVISEVSQDRKRQMLYDLSYMWNLKK